jgi:MFS family permease
MVALANWLSVSIVAVVGPKVSLIVSGALYVFYIAALIRPYVPVVFVGAFIVGTGGGVLWTAQGNILIQNSSKVRMGTTSGIFWLMLESSLVLGNLFLFVFLYIFEKNGKIHQDKCIDVKVNYAMFSVLTVLAVLGVLVFFLIVPVTRPATGYRQLDSGDTGKHLPIFITAIMDALKLFFTVDMLLLSFCFIYTGYELNFWSGVYGTIIGNTFPYYTIGLAGLFIGLGEIIGGGTFGILGHYTNRWGRDPVVLLGMLSHFITFLLIFYNLPNAAIHGKVTDGHGQLFNSSNIYIAMLCAFLLGFGDACYNTQIYSILGVLYPTDDKSTPAIALFKFFQSMAAFVGFLTSTLISLQWVLLVLSVLAVLGTMSFAIVEWRNYKASGEQMNTSLNKPDYKHLD